MVRFTRYGFFCALALAFLLPTKPALAHKFKCFATVDGTTVSGYAWFGGGGRPKNQAFRVLAPDGKVLHEGKTNDNGEFSFEATVRCDLLIVVEGGEGHEARFTVGGDELPEALPAYGAAGKIVEETPAARQPDQPTEAAPAAVIDDKALARLVKSAVHKEVTPLRIELEEFKEETRMQDVISGIGYLVGIAGIAFYFLGVMRKRKG